GIISAVMGSDTHQVLAVSTMFTKDVFAYYGGKDKYGEQGSVHFARAFIVVVTVVAYVVALVTPESIFELAVRFAFSGFAAMAPVMVAALFWKRSTKWGALAASIFVAVTLAGSAVLANTHKPGEVLWQVGEHRVVYLTAPPPRPARGGARPGMRPGAQPGGPAGAAAPGSAGGPGPTERPGSSARPGAEGAPRPPGARPEGATPGRGARGEGAAAGRGAPPRTPPFNPDVRVL